MGEIAEYFRVLLTQFGGGPGPTENNLVRFGLAAFFWGVLLVVAWTRQRQNDLPRERWLVWGFGIAFARELFMFSHVSWETLTQAENKTGCIISEPLEHALTLAAIAMVAGAFLRYILQDNKVSRRFLQIGLGATAACYLITFLWWPVYLSSNPTIKFHNTWGAWLFHITASLLIVAAVYLLFRQRGWLRNVVLLALLFLFLAEFLMLINFATDKAYSYALCPISNNFHIWAIPLLGFVYIRELFIERKQAEEELVAYRNHLEELVVERTNDLTQANQNLQIEVMERKRANAAVEKLSWQNQMILDSAGEGIFGVSVDGVHTFVNPAAASMLGFELNELIGKPSHATWHHSKPDGSPYPENECPLHAGYKNGTVCRGDDQVFWRKDGTGFPAQYASTPTYEDGKLTGAVVVFQDITDRRQAEEMIIQRNIELATQNAIAATISQSLDLTAILDMALDKALIALEMDQGAVFTFDPNEQTLSVQVYRGKAELQDGLRLTEECSLCQEITHQSISQMEPIILDVSDDSANKWFRVNAREKIQTLVSTPLVSKNRAMGALTLGSKQKNAVLPQDIELLTVIGQQIGIAVDNAYLYQKAERWAKQLALLHQVSIFLSSTLDPFKIYDQIAEQSVKLLNSHTALVFRWDEDQHQATGVSCYGSKEVEVEDLDLQPGDNSTLSQIIRHRRPVPIEDAQNDSRIGFSWLNKIPARALLCMPVQSIDNLFGLLVLIDLKQPRRWRHDEIQMVESFTNRAAIALENAYLHKQVKQVSTLAERQRIAAEMHDGLAQTLSYLGYNIDMVSEYVETGCKENALLELENIHTAVDQASKEVRQSISSLQASPQPSQSLQEWLGNLVDEFNSQQELQIQLVTQLQDPLFIAPKQIEQIIPVVKEGLLNASRHALAKTITVCLNTEGNEARIIIKDDGQGFDPDMPPSSVGDHFGLKIMRARAARIDGQLIINSRAGLGTRVTLSWTLDPKKTYAKYISTDTTDMMEEANDLTAKKGDK